MSREQPKSAHRLTLEKHFLNMQTPLLLKFYQLLGVKEYPGLRVKHNLDSESNRLQRNYNLGGEDFRFLFNTNSGENSEMIIETSRIISDEITNQVTGN